jgi:alpha-glucosidase
VSTQDLAWWRHAAIYEIYPRSFADGNGDGEGDLRGVIDRLPYVAGLGVDALWIAPWYPSPMADGGYDVTDHRDIDPRFGTLADAEELLDRAHALGLRVLVDLVVNHTSEQHPWFRQALAAAPGSPARARYFFRDGRGPEGGEPPTNWISAFGGSAWTRTTDPDGSPGQWYLHTFAPEQPDLDWSSPRVAEDVDGVLRFWLDRGVDGFRVDAASAMAKPAGLPDADPALQVAWTPREWADHPQWDTDGVHDIFRRWRRVIDDHPGEQVTVAEAVVKDPERLARYVRPDELHTAFNFTFMHASWDATVLRSVVDDTLASLAPSGAPATWALSSHDEVRPVTRLGRTGGITDPVLGRRRARAAALLTFALPGGVYVYQGDELGLAEVEDLPEHALQDPVYRRTAGRARGRDGCRVPLPWSGHHPPYGFTDGPAAPWLPQPATWSDRTVEAEDGDPGSVLNLYREALRLRRGFRDEPGLVWAGDPSDRVLDFRRGDRLRCVVNLGPTPVDLPGPPTLWSEPGSPDGRLPTDTAAWYVG